MEPDHLRDDLRAEVALILLETDEKKLQEIHQGGGLRYYTVRIIMNLIQSKTSPFYKTYRMLFSELDVNKQYDARYRTPVVNHKPYQRVK
jgi:hypothetical protein